MKPKFSEIRENFKKYADTWDESFVNHYNLATLRDAKTFYTHPGHEAETWFNALSGRVSKLEQSQSIERDTKWRIATISISVIALIVSIPISIKSCWDSSEALRFSKETFEETQKPELVLRPSNREGKEGYVRYLAYDDSFDVIVYIRIENIGKRPATNIVYPHSLMAINIRGQDIMLETEDVRSPISLSFQQYHFRKKEFTINTKGLDPKEVIQQLKNKDVPTRLEIAVKYTDATTSKDYVVSAEYLIREVNFDILKYEQPKLVPK